MAYSSQKSHTKKPTSPSASDLLALFEQLSPAHQDILLLLAMLYLSIGQQSLQNLMQKLPHFKADARLIDAKLKKTLGEKQLLIAGPSGWYCSPQLSEVLMRRAVNKTWFNDTAKTIINSSDNRFYYYNNDQIAKQMRLFLYLGNEAGFASNLAQLELSSPNFCKEHIQRIFFDDFDENWFASLPEMFRFLPLKAFLNQALRQLDDISEPYQRLEQFLGASKPETLQITHTIIHIRLMRANWQDAETWLANDNTGFGLALQASLHFLQDRNDEAVELFLAAVKQLKKESGKRNISIYGLLGLFFSLAMLRTRNSEHLAYLAKHHFPLCQKQDSQFGNIYTLLIPALDVYQARLRLDNNSRLLHASSYPYELLIHVLLLRSLGETSQLNNATWRAMLKQLAAYCSKAEQFGYYWYAGISSVLLQRLDYTDKKIGQIAAKYAEQPFVQVVDLWPVIAPWERALTALTQLGVQGGGSAQPLQELRMVWSIGESGDSFYLMPKEQRLGKNGRWTKGRAVALKKLYHELASYEYLSDQDRKICQHIDFERDSDYYYGRETYSLNEEGLLVAAGHPAIFWENQENAEYPVSISVVEPQLLVKEEGTNLKVKLIPSIKNNSRIVAEKTANGGLLLYAINDSHRLVADILGPNGLTVPVSAKQQLIDSISSVASMLTVQSDVGGSSVHAREVSGDSRLHVHLQPVGDGLQIEIYAQPFLEGGPLYKPGIGGTTVLAEIKGEQLQTTRNLDLEKTYLEWLFENCPGLYRESDCRWLLDDPEIALEILLQLQALGDYALLEWPKGKKISLSQELGLSETRFSVRQERDWFSVEGELVVNDQQVFNLQRLLNLLANSKGRFLKLEDGQIVALTRELRQRLDDLTGLGDVHNDSVRFHPLAAQTLSDLTEGMNVKAQKAWRDQLKRLNELTDLNPQPPSTLQGELRDYQREGFQWMTRLAHWGAGACLADDMGLGKTVQALALILSRAPNGPTLILAPTSVCINWLEESQRFAPTLNVQHFGHGDRQAMLDNADAFDLIVCSYGLLQTEAERLAQKRWHTLVADEAQAIKNTLTKRSKAAMSLQADFKLITTGTPIENHLGELWNLFNFINPGLLGSLSKFNERYAQAIENNHDHATQQRLKKLLRPFILRRLKNDVLTELPPRTEMTLHIELSTEERELYEALRRNAMINISAARQEAGNAQLKALAEIMKLRRACCHPRLVMEESTLSSSKLQAFEELVEELLANRHKALVFSQFVGHLNLIRERLDAKGIHYHYLDGSTPVPERKKSMNAFQAGQGDLFLISLKAGGTGLNLTAADYVIHMDPWWNPAVEDQASDRAHRMGQQRPVTIYRLVAKDTIEDKIVDLHRHKRDLANSLLEGGEVSGKMSIEDMMALLDSGD